MKKVEMIDYKKLVADMAEAGLTGMGDVLVANLHNLGKPETNNEVKYFWAALFNAAKADDAVWLWLCTAPHIRTFAPPEAQFHTMPQFVADMPLPVIGCPDDAPYEPVEILEACSAEPTTENLAAQASLLDARLREAGERNPSNRCKTIREYVATFYYSGNAQSVARTQMIEQGLMALATQEGIQYLRENYPPTKER